MGGKALLAVGLILILSSVLVAVPQPAARAQVGGYNVFPTAEEDDAKMLCIVGRGQQTFAFRPLKMWIGIEEGETTEDMEYTLETVACIGVCALAPNLVIGKDTHGNMNPKKVSQLFGERKGGE